VTLTQLFFNSEGPTVSLTAKQLAVLAAIHDLGPVGACCADLQWKIAADCGHEPRLATLYSILSDLERKGLLKTIDLALPENGGRPRRLYQLTKVGARALSLGEVIVQHLADECAQPA
jgi:PadR family transcriptional regulator